MKNLLNAFILFSLFSFSLLQAGSPSPEEQAEAVKALCAQATALEKLHQARPNLLIQTGGGSGIGGDGSEKRVPNIDQESNWDGGVTTHG